MTFGDEVAGSACVICFVLAHECINKEQLTRINTVCIFWSMMFWFIKEEF
jgi:hypothetical protein